MFEEDPMDPQPTDPSIAEAARQRGVAEKTIRRRIADGTLEAYRVGPRLIRIRAASLVNLEQPLAWAKK